MFGIKFDRPVPILSRREIVIFLFISQSKHIGNVWLRRRKTLRSLQMLDGIIELIGAKLLKALVGFFLGFRVRESPIRGQSAQRPRSVRLKGYDEYLIGD